MFVSNDIMGKRAQVRNDARVHGGTFERSTEVRLIAENFYGDYEVRDDFGNCGSIHRDNLEMLHATR